MFVCSNLQGDSVTLAHLQGMLGWVETKKHSASSPAVAIQHASKEQRVRMNERRGLYVSQYVCQCISVGIIVSRQPLPWR